MSGFRSRLLLPLVMVGSTYYLAAEAGADDFSRISGLPAPEVNSLHMRMGARGTAETGAEAAKPSPTKAVARTAEPTYSQLSYQAIPSERRDLRERIVFKTNLGYSLDANPLSGAAGINGVAPTLGERRQYILGDAVVGSRGILLPSLSTYFLSRFRFDAGGDQFSATRRVYDSEGAPELHIRAGYAELDGLGGEPGGLLDSIFVRAGRQYRYGASRFVSNFDGLTMRYAKREAEISAFVGQRVALFLNDEPGLVAGFGGIVHGRELVDLPVDLNVDYLRYDAGQSLPSRHVIESKARIRLAHNTRLYVQGRAVDSGDEQGIGIGSLGTQLRQNLGDELIVIADLEKNFSRGMSFDYVGALSMDIVNVGQQLGFAFSKPQPATLAALRLSYQISERTEGHAFYRNKFVSDKGGADAYSRPFQEVGAALSGLVADNFTLTTQYKYRRRDLESVEMVDESNFARTQGAGLKQIHEISANARLTLGKGKAIASLGAYGRVFDFATPYILVEDDAIGGGRLELSRALSELMRVRVEGELAKPSRALSPDLDALYSLRLLMEAEF